jgi:hypothetical protein
MNAKTEIDPDLTVQSFAYVAKKLALSSTQYEQILNEAEKHRSALRLVERDLCEMAEQAWRNATLTKAEFLRMCERAAMTIARAQQSITQIAARYAPHKLAA